MLKYHVTPISPKSVFSAHFQNRNVVIPFLDDRQYKHSLNFCDKIIIDNSAYSFFTQKKQANWQKFYKWLENKKREFFFIPDVINGSEEENNYLIDSCPFSDGVPVFHLHEKNKRLEMLMCKFNYIALGSSGDFWQIGTLGWHNRMNELMDILCDSSTGKPVVKIHMLRCLNKDIFTLYPFYSGDSTNFARNHHLYKSTFEKEQFLRYMESFNSPKIYKKQLSILNL